MNRLRLAVIIVGLLVGTGAAIQLIPVSVVVPVSKPSGVLSGVSAEDRQKFRDFYEALADIVVRDGQGVAPVCKSVFDLRGRHRNALWCAFGATNMVGKYAGLGDRLDAYLLSAVGDTDVALTPELRQAAAKAFLEIR